MNPDAIGTDTSTRNRLNEEYHQARLVEMDASVTDRIERTVESAIDLLNARIRLDRASRAWSRTDI